MVLTSLPKIDKAMFKSEIEDFPSNPVICKWLPRSGLQVCLLNVKEKARLSTKDKVRKLIEKNERHTGMSLALSAQKKKATTVARTYT